MVIIDIDRVYPEGGGDGKNTPSLTNRPNAPIYKTSGPEVREHPGPGTSSPELYFYFPKASAP